MTTPAQPDPRNTAIAAALSVPRLGPYLAATGGYVQDALRLYEWNVELSGAVYEVLHIVEVVLRNAIDRQLAAWNVTQADASTGRQHAAGWLMDPSRLLVRLLGQDLVKARDRARTAVREGKPGGRTAGHDDVLAQLTFGTWRYLLPGRDPGRQYLWRNTVHLAFPYLASTPATLVSKVDGIYRLRNRVAHFEPVLRGGVVRAEFNNMRAVLGAIDPHVEGWFVSNQRVTHVLRSRP